MCKPCADAIVYILHCTLIGKGRLKRLQYAHCNNITNCNCTKSILTLARCEGLIWCNNIAHCNVHIVIILQIAIAHCVRRMPFLPYRISQKSADAFVALANEQKTRMPFCSVQPMCGCNCLYIVLHIVLGKGRLKRLQCAHCNNITNCNCTKSILTLARCEGLTYIMQ